MKRDLLIELINDDEHDLLRVKSSIPLQSANDRLISAFQEINEFIRENGREPHPHSEDTREFSLGKRLESFRQNADHARLLTGHDTFKVLEIQKALTSIEDIFKTDDFDLLGIGFDDIFKLTHIPKTPTTPDYIAQRKVCPNFQEFEDLFIQCQTDLSAGKRKLLPFANEQQIEKGDFFVLKRVLTYVAAVGEKEFTKGKTNARLHCVFENGTESDMLLRSLAGELYKDGKKIIVHEDRLLDGLKGVTSDDRESGYIYVLQSQSQRAEIQSINHLYKVGFSRAPVEVRIKNAAQEPTYLMAPVSLVASYLCFNLNPQKFELLLHTFFANACLNVDVFDRDGQRHTPREWFVVPIHVINQAIELLISGNIVNYRYDHNRQEIVERD